MPNTATTESTTTTTESVNENFEPQGTKVENLQVDSIESLIKDSHQMPKGGGNFPGSFKSLIRDLGLVENDIVTLTVTSIEINASAGKFHDAGSVQIGLSTDQNYKKYGKTLNSENKLLEFREAKVDSKLTFKVIPYEIKTTEVIKGKETDVINSGLTLDLIQPK